MPDSTPHLRNIATPRSIAVDDIDVPDGGLRRMPPSAEQEAGMLDSVRRLGILQPVIVRPHPRDLGRYLLVAGRRRLRAARGAGLSHIPAELHDALDDADAAAIEAAENVQRVAMAPVDQWRAIARLQDLGWDLDGAAAALGIPQRLARRLAKLGRLHPDMLAAIERHGMPQDRELGVIANAPLEMQAAALAAKRPAWSWWDIAGACRIARIPMGRAIFDTAASGLAWEEDLFAPTDSAEQWTTRDAHGFLAAQKAALEAAATASKGRIVVAAEKYGQPVIPHPHVRLYNWNWGDEIPAGHQVHAFVREHDGQVVHACSKTLTKKEAAEDPDAELGEEDEDEDGAGDTGPATRRAKEAPGRLTHAGREMIAQAKTEALRAALRDGHVTDPWQLLALLLIGLGADNLVLENGAGDEDIVLGEVMAAALRERENPPMLAAIAREALARLLRVTPRKHDGAGGYGYGGSGAAAELVGEIICADRFLPALDAAKLLAECGEEALTDACRAAGVTPGTTPAATRKALLAKADRIALPEVRFGGPVSWPIPGELPNPAECGARTGKADCDICGWQRDAKKSEAEPCSASLWGDGLARLGLSLDDIEVDSVMDIARLKAPPAPPAAAPAPTPEDFAAQRAEDAKAFDAPAAATATIECAWNGTTPCREDGTTRCGSCPRHERYTTWLATPAGRTAQRAQQNAEARASLRRARKPKGAEA